MVVGCVVVWLCDTVYLSPQGLWHLEVVMFSINNATSRANSELLNIKAIANDPLVDPVKRMAAILEIAREYERSLTAGGFGHMTRPK